MVESEKTYEQIRLNRVEENKKKLDEFGLNKIAQSLRVSSSSSLKPSLVKPRMPRVPVELLEVRRSSRVKNAPQSYRELGEEPLERPRKNYQRRNSVNRVYASDEARMNSMERAEKLQSRLETEFPSFIKPMLHSHVTQGFWLGLPVQFCKTHLPKHDEHITLVDEEDGEFVTKYLAEKTGLSAGWRGFAIDHRLVDGDCVVFHLVTPTKFKVYIIRVNDDDHDAKNDSNGGNGDKENDDIESNKKQEENISEARQLPSNGKRKRRGKK